MGLSVGVNGALTLLTLVLQAIATRGHGEMNNGNIVLVHDFDPATFVCAMQGLDITETAFRHQLLQVLYM